MTEKNKVSLIAFSVLVLGMLGFFAALAVDLYSSMQPQMTTPPTPTPSHSLQSQVLLERTRLGGTMRNVQLAIAGAGQVLPQERAQGVEQVACYHLSFQYPAPALRGSPPRISDSALPVQSVSYWTAVTESRIAKRSGSTWTEGSSNLAESDWYTHACPGAYTLDSVEAARARPPSTP